MDINEILQQIYTLYDEGRGAEAEQLMKESIATAEEKQDNSSLLQLLNELLGYYRETSRVEESYQVAERALALAERMGLCDTIPYATTLLNAANAYRAGGRLQDSLECYKKTREIYDKLLAPEDMLVASLENNLSLLYQEMGDFASAKESLLRALPIVTAQDAHFEVAVTYTNLASTCMQLEQTEEARDYADRAIAGFKEQGVRDAHFGAALSALGTYHYRKGDYAAAEAAFKEAMDIMEEYLGRNDYYYRLEENVKACREAAKSDARKMEAVDEPDGAQIDMDKAMAGRADKTLADTDKADADKKGLALCREYYEAYGRPMIEEKFPEYLDKIAVGLVGEGSDCFGFDDAVSRDHDFGPDFCMWVTDETYEQIGEALQQAYDELPQSFQGVERTQSFQGAGRRGVLKISSFYQRLLGTDRYEEIDYARVEDASLAAAVNGEVFRDEEGIFTAFREKLLQGYPQPVHYLKLAESAAKFSQAGQYNYKRMCERGDALTAALMLGDCIREAMKLKHYIEGVYPPHDKWLHQSLQNLKGGRELAASLESLQKASSAFCAEDTRTQNTYTQDLHTQDGALRICALVEEIGAALAKELYEGNFISDIEAYLDAHTPELLQKSALSKYSNEELVEKIAALEFEAFDKVKNVGGRASCQNDWATFSIMRKSQYLTWNRAMLLQYLYDFSEEYQKGHNLITEKYGRMMESTAREEYERIKGNFPELSEEKKAIIEEIVKLQVGWMENFSARYPALADNARSIHTYEDNLYNTSYETYLRGEISTYSDKMLELYGRYVVECAKRGGNLAEEIMTISTKLYGYKSLDWAEKFLAE
ncbi:MAG: DUF4125 family protein [Lachnoclostridium sp.]|nr:DUF4125 family protein [Lachnospira sp.]MCM1249038.1 DUF4125 family protein [Lachnoclostridium sp.]